MAAVYSCLLSEFKSDESQWLGVKGQVIEASLAEAERGEFANVAEVNAVFAKYGSRFAHFFEQKTGFKFKYKSTPYVYAQFNI
jgi:hypothetical protein